MRATQHHPEPVNAADGPRPTPLGVETELARGVTVVRVTGEVDAASAAAFAAALDEAAGHGQPVRLDLAGTTFIDSAGIRILVRSMWALRESGSSLCLVSASEPAENILRITGILDVLKEPAP